MRVIFSLLLLACVVFISVTGDCGTLETCGEGHCCSGSFYHRFCREFSDDGEPCERPNKWEKYSVACPCKEGLICSVINRCQTEF